MAQGIRGANPIWAGIDLQGNLFDDSFYMFVLENTIPYIPADVYHDPDFNTIWTNPIQFLANGTLPTDIFFNADDVYRLEFRQGNTQMAPLIYEINDYVAGEGGSSPVDTVATTSGNQISNPQFALVNFTSPYTFSGSNPTPILVGPGWFLELAGTGTVTLTQVPLNNNNPNQSNAPFALQITLTGWNDNQVFLRQRFEQNGMLWANKIVSSAITTRINGAFQGIQANLIDSNNTPLTQVLQVPTVNADFVEYTGHGELLASTNPNTPPAAYIDYKLSLPINTDIYVTSIQLIVEDLPIEQSFIQDSINRQIDHTYHNAYPIVPVGTIIDYGGFGVPLHYLQCVGQALSRTLFNLLFQAVTHLETVTLNSTTTFTVANGSMYRIGMPVEGPGINAGTGIANIVGNTITLSATSVLTGPATLRFFTVLNGDGSTTFNNYNLADYVIAGTGGTSYLPVASNGVGAIFGAATHAITIAEMPAHNHPGSTAQIFGSGGGGALATPVNVTPGAATALNIASQGGGSAMSLAQLTAFMTKCIRFE